MTTLPIPEATLREYVARVNAAETLQGLEIVEFEGPVAGEPGFTEHRVVFAREITLAEWERYVAERRYFGYPPAGYGGTARVKGCAGIWRRYSTCD